MSLGTCLLVWLKTKLQGRANITRYDQDTVLFTIFRQSLFYPSSISLSAVIGDAPSLSIPGYGIRASQIHITTSRCTLSRIPCLYVPSDSVPAKCTASTLSI